MAKSQRAKYGYLSYDDMFARIRDGQLDEYDIVFTKDTKECCIITPDLVPSPIKSKVYTFDSVEDAEKQLNVQTDTYAGMVVSILSGDVYIGYIVNKRDGAFYVSPLCESEKEIDYNTLGNKPIVNLTGTLDNPIQLSTLDDGTYSVTGQYKVDDSDETVYLSASPTLCMVAHEDDTVRVKTINSYQIYDYIVQDGTVNHVVYLTEQYLTDNGYATKAYVDEKILALDFVTKEEVESYIDEKIKQAFDTQLDTVIEEKVSAKVEESMEEVSDTDIKSLFTEN